MRVLTTLLLSLAASALATYLLRALVSVDGESGEERAKPIRNVNVVVVVPVMAGNHWIIGNRRLPRFLRRGK